MPSAFISYSWDDPGHIFWARALGARLRTDGIAVSLDKGQSIPDDQVMEFLERTINTNEYVLVICTPRYKDRSEKRVASRGYEGDIMSAEIKTSGNQRKFIPLLRSGEWGSAGPLWLSEHFIDMRDGPRYEEHYQELVATLLGARARASQAAPVAPAPKPVQATKSATEEPIRIVGVIEDEVGQPRNNGTHLSTLYHVPLLLSRMATRNWERAFEELWNRSQQFATIRKASIARVYGDRLVLNCTTLEEVLTDHRKALLLAVGEVNRSIAEQEADLLREKESRQKLRESHRQRVHELAEKIRFDGEH